ncbi:TetR/AcrR family transcriptional regulator [Pseudorhizobium marinum]|uniref:TetR/AcrR family transcriptional regulator n=1 Tax=Pseudorhizobium marinum TaxID=1496690 RepID=UPI000495B59A|nr:TetR/AcrR family transcriptional regulator [Pseudorhizobium marinum]
MIADTLSTPPSRAPGRPREFDLDEALDAAILVFSERGYHGTSISELKDAMGLTAGSIYKAFKDKRTVFLAAFDRYKAVRAALLDARLSQASSGRARVATVVRFYAEAACGETGRRGCLAIGAAVELTLFDEEVAQRVGGHNARLVERIEGFIREGQADGSIAGHVDASGAALAVFCYLQGIRIAGKTGRHDGAALASAEAILRILD